MRPAYVSVDLGDPEDKELPSFTITPVPLLYREGEVLIPSEAELQWANSYSELCTVLKEDFQIPDAMLPPAKYFKPTKTEREKEERYHYRTVVSEILNGEPRPARLCWTRWMKQAGRYWTMEK